MTTTRQTHTGGAGRPTAPTDRLFSGSNRTTTIGILLVITLAAFESMAVATAMPRAVAALHGLAYYSWPFTAFLVLNVVGVVAGGEICDHIGPRRPLITGLGIFFLGLLVAGTAPEMTTFVVGRAVQGFGSGLVIVSVYIVIAEAYPDSMRPKMFAALSAAWVLPSLVGPVISGALTQHVTWRAVFLLIAPFVLLGLVLVLPALRRLPPHARDAGASAAPAGRWRFALLAGVGIAALQYAGQRLQWVSLLPAAIGVALLIVGVPRLIPAGTVRFRRGLPTVIALRGIVAGAFFAVDSYVPLTLTSLHGYGATAAGIPLTLGSIGWSLGSWWQGHNQTTARTVLMRGGFFLVAIAAAGMTLMTMAGMPGWIAYAAWIVGGTGIGTVMPILSVLMLDLSPVADRGANSSALQLTDMMTSAITIGIGGVLVAAAEHGRWSLGHAIGVTDILMVGVALVGTAVAGRVARTAPR